MFQVHDSDRFSTRLKITSTQNALTLPMIHLTVSVNLTSCQTCCNIQNLFFLDLFSKKLRNLSTLQKKVKKLFRLLPGLVSEMSILIVKVFNIHIVYIVYIICLLFILIVRDFLVDISWHCLSLRLFFSIFWRNFILIWCIFVFFVNFFHELFQHYCMLLYQMASVRFLSYFHLINFM